MINSFILLSSQKVNYAVFRAVAIPCVAEKRGVSVEELLSRLSKQSGPTLNGVTTAEKVRFYDDEVTK